MPTSSGPSVFTRVAMASGWFPPLEYVGHYFVLTKDEDYGDNFGEEQAVYQVHNCDSIAAAAYQDRQANHDGFLTANDNVKLSQWEYALKRPCDKCGVKKNKKCINLNNKVDKATGEIANTAWPHDLRVVGWVKESTNA